MTNALRDQTIVEAYVAGWRQDQLAELHKTSRQNISRILRKDGVTKGRTGRPKLPYDAMNVPPIQYTRWRRDHGAAMAREMAGLAQ
jgi:hypothetical protein